MQGPVQVRDLTDEQFATLGRLAEDAPECRVVGWQRGGPVIAYRGTHRVITREGHIVPTMVRLRQAA